MMEKGVTSQRLETADGIENVRVATIRASRVGQTCVEFDTTL